MDKSIIKNLGLTDYEVEIFLTLIKSGPLSVYEISKKTGLYRQACYDALNRLQEKGIVSFVLKNGKKIFRAIDPNKISELLDEKKRQFDSLLPELLKMQILGKDDISVEIFKGKNIIKIALKDIINILKDKGGEVLCTAIDESFAESTDKLTIEQYERDLINFNIRERIITRKGMKTFFTRGKTKYKYIDKKYFNPNPIITYGNKVQMIMWGNPNYLIIITNKNISNSFKKQFKLMWESVKK